MATREEGHSGRMVVDYGGNISESGPAMGKIIHRKGRKRRDKKKRDEILSSTPEGQNKMGDLFTAANFQRDNLTKLQRQLTENDRLQQSTVRAGRSRPVLDQSEADARIAAAEAMSFLASGGGFFQACPQDTNSNNRPSSASSSNSSGSVEGSLVIDYSVADADTPTTTGHECEDVQEDTVSSSSASKRQMRASKSPVIASILENGRSKFHVQESSPVTSANSQLSASNEQGCVRKDIARSPVLVQTTQQHQQVMSVGHFLAKTSVPSTPVLPEIAKEIAMIVNKRCQMPPSNLHYQGDEYYPAVKKIRTVDTQTGGKAMETEMTESIPDIHGLSLHPSHSSPNGTVVKGNPTFSEPVTNPLLAAGIKKELPGNNHGRCSGASSVLKNHSSRLLAPPNGLSSAVVSDQAEERHSLSPQRTAASNTFAPIQRDGGQYVRVHGGALSQAESVRPMSSRPADSYRPPLPLSILDLPRRPGLPMSCTPTHSPVTDPRMMSESSLQIAQKEALQRLSDNLARATPKERAFMLGQIQAIVTLQKASQLGQRALTTTLGSCFTPTISPACQTAVAPSVAQRSTPASTDCHTISPSLVKDGHSRSTHIIQTYIGQHVGTGMPKADRVMLTDNSQSLGQGRLGAEHGSVLNVEHTPAGLCTSPVPQTVLQMDPSSHQIMSFSHQHPSTPVHVHVAASAASVISPGAPQIAQTLSPAPAARPGSSGTGTPGQTRGNKHPQVNTDTGSHLPFKKRRMAEYSSDSSKLTNSSVVEGVSLSPVPVTPTAPRQRPALTGDNQEGSPLAAQRVPGLSDIQTALQKDEDGDVPLHIAAAQGNVAAVEKFIGLMKLAGSPVDVTNKDRQTPLQIAVVINDNEVVKRLLRAGASVNLPNSIGQTAIHLATKAGHTRCLRSLITGHKDAHLDKKDFEGYSPLHLAVQSGHMDVIQTLLDHGADTNVQDGKSGRTPLFHAAENNQFDIVDMLLKAPARVNVMNYAGSTAVMAASSRAHKDVVTLLMQYGADTKGTNILDITSKGPPVRSSTNAALRQTVSTPSPTPDSDGSPSGGERRYDRGGRNRNGPRKNKSKKSSA